MSFDYQQNLMKALAALADSNDETQELEKIALTPVPMGDPTNPNAGQAPVQGADPSLPGTPGQDAQAQQMQEQMQAQQMAEQQMAEQQAAQQQAQPQQSNAVAIDPETLNSFLDQKFQQWSQTMQQQQGGGQGGGGGKGGKGQQMEALIKNLSIDAHHNKKILSALVEQLGLTLPQLEDPTRDPNTGLPLEQKEQAQGQTQSPAPPAAPAQPKAASQREFNPETDIGFSVSADEIVDNHPLFSKAKSANMASALSRAFKRKK